MFDAFFRPSSVAVIGASSRPGKVGYNILDNLVRYGYTGQVYPINPSTDEILGQPVVASVDQLPQGVDLAVIAVPASAVAESIRQIAAQGIEAAVIVSAGFKEIGGQGRRYEAELAQAIKDTGVRVIGPNCIGIMDTRVGLNATFAQGMPDRGSIGFFSQSGAMCLAILDWSLDNKIGFSKFISLGNKIDLTETEILELLAQDEDTKVIMGYLEAVEDGRRFMEVAKRVTRIKPVVLVKSGITAAGARAASSHTGALAGADAAYEAAFAQCGVLRAHSVRELFSLAQALACQPSPKGPAMAMVTNSGGPGIIAADAVENKGMHLAGLRPETVAELRTELPPIATCHNPVDLTGGAPASMYQFAMETVVRDPGVDGLVVIMTPTATMDPMDFAQRICQVATDKPVFAVMMGRHTVEKSRLYCMEQGLPAYDFPEDAVGAMRGLLDYGRWRNSPPSQPEMIERDQSVPAAIIKAMREKGRLHMSETEAGACFAAYGIRVATSRFAATSQEAVGAAQELGFPVVMKIDSPAISHKSDVGGVRVGLADADHVREAFHDMTGQVNRVQPSAWVRGVLIQEMVRGGRETIVGFSKDPQFGHLLMFGLGGIYVEVLKDVSFRVAPINRQSAEEMVKSIRSFPLLRGVRGEPPTDVPALAGALLALSTLAADFPELAEADINPLLVLPRGAGVVAVDARMSLSPVKGEE